jgi:phage N-6-adenine-methyltransferase
MIAPIKRQEEKFDNDTWQTPQEIIRWVNDLWYPITFDAACTTKNCVARDGAFYDLGMDGLDIEWRGVVWCNPPYSNILPWVLKAQIETFIGRCDRAYMLIPCDTSSKTFKAVYKIASKIIFFTGRIAFINPYNGARFRGNRHASMLVIFDGSMPGILKTSVADIPEPNYGLQNLLEFVKKEIDL